MLTFMRSWICIKALCFLMLLSLCLAQERWSMAGTTQEPQHVFARDAKVSLWEGNRPVARCVPGTMYEVIQAKGPWLWVGRGWLRREDVVALQDAVSFFAPGSAIDDGAFALVNRARARYELHDYAGAVSDCEEALRIHPSSAAALSMRARILLRLDRRADALADVTEAIRLDPRFATAYATRAHAWLEDGQFDKAVEDATRAIELDSKSAWALAARGKAYCKLGDHRRAIADFDQALAINPNLHAVWNNRGNAYFKAGDFTRAVSDYTVALRIAPSAQIYFNRAVAWARLGRLDKAHEDRLESARLDPKFAPAGAESAASAPGA